MRKMLNKLRGCTRYLLFGRSERVALVSVNLQFILLIVSKPFFRVPATGAQTTGPLNCVVFFPNGPASSTPRDVCTKFRADIRRLTLVSM